jgi:hypothetical protein
MRPQSALFLSTLRRSFALGLFPTEPNSWELRSITYHIEPIPEPATLMLIGAGLLGFAARRWSGAERVEPSRMCGLT